MQHREAFGARDGQHAVARKPKNEKMSFFFSLLKHKKIIRSPTIPAALRVTPRVLFFVMQVQCTPSMQLRWGELDRTGKHSTVEPVYPPPSPRTFPFQFIPPVRSISNTCRCPHPFPSPRSRGGQCSRARHANPEGRPGTISCFITRAVLLSKK